MRRKELKRGDAVVTEKGLSSLMRTLGRQLRNRLALTFSRTLPPRPSPRMSVVEKVSRNALAELVGRAKSHPQLGELNSANPAYAALAELTAESGLPGLALGVKFETGEITFLDLNLPADKVEKSGGAYVERRLNVNLWRRLEELIYREVDKTMLGPRRPIRPPEEVDI